MQLRSQPFTLLTGFSKECKDNTVHHFTVDKCRDSRVVILLRESRPTHPLRSAHLVCVGFICVFMCVFARQLTQRELGQTHSEREVYCKLATSDLGSRIFLAVDQQHVVFIDST